MIVRAVDDKNNWIFGKGSSSYKNNIDAFIQTVETKIKEWKNDCFFNQDAGIDWVSRLGKSNPSFLQADLKTIISGIEEVIAVEDVSITKQARNLTISYNVSSIYGGLEGQTII